MSDFDKPDQPWTLDVDQTLEQAGVSADSGLASDEIADRRRKFGRNMLARVEGRSWLSILVDQFKSLVIGLLAVASLVSIFIGQVIEAIAVAAAIVINTIIGFVTEWKAVRSMDAIRQLSRVTARVRRDGKVDQMPAEKLVIGDIVVIEPGDIISADLRVIEASNLRVNESALTGESVPVAKETGAVAEDTPLADRTCMLYKGTSVTSGSGLAVVVAVGRETEIGQIQEMVEQAEDETTPLEKRLDRLAYRLIWVTLGLAATVGIIGTLRGKESALMIKSAVALAVAAIPEGLPIVATVALARGMLHMARRNALVNRLASVETLGSTNVIGTDKTGTLTENRMTVRHIRLADNAIDVSFSDGEARLQADGEPANLEKNDPLKEAIRASVLCNNAELSDDTDDHGGYGGTGDPMEVALLSLGERLDIRRSDLLKDMPEAREEAFDQDTRMMATFHEKNDGYYVAVKGAPEAVLEKCQTLLTVDGEREISDQDRESWSAYNDELAADGLRLLAVAMRNADAVDTDPYQEMTFIGLIGLLDPAREDVPEAIDECRRAGIKVIMMTGDQPGTAKKIALDVGLEDDHDTPVKLGKDVGEFDDLSQSDREELRRVSIFARVSPRQKLTVIDVHHDGGAVVAMTGDGVNDAPALKNADIGIAMGQRGTEVAKQASDMILQDDAFSTIVAAIHQGRIIFGNVRKFIVYLLSGNVGEILAVAAASFLQMPLPLLPLQILFLNLVLDVFPALALGMGGGPPGIMREAPRSRSEAVLTRAHWEAVAIYGVVIAASVLLSLYFAQSWLSMSGDEAVTISFLTLSLSRLFHVFNMRYPKSGIVVNEVSRNVWVWGAIGLVLIILGGAVYMPGLSGILGLTSPGLVGWLLALGLSSIPLWLGQSGKALRVIRV